MGWRGLLAAMAVAAVAAGCRLDPEGRCETRADCAAGLDCLAGVCAACRTDADCAAWEGCGVDGLCAPEAGRCGTDADCASWEACSAAHSCALRADHCPSVACSSLQECDPEHHCSLEPGRCVADGDCGSWMASCDTAANRCLFPAADGADVLAFGTLVEGRCDLGAVVRASSAATPAAVRLGLDCGAAPDGRAALDPVTGLPVFRHGEAAGGDTLRMLRLDAAAWDASASVWRVPADPVADDDTVLAPAQCPVAWDRWIMQAGTGALMYACAVGGEPLQRDFFDDAGVRRVAAVREILAWNADDYLLVLSGAGAVQVVAPAGTATTAAPLPAGAHLAHRSVAGGFRVALHDDSSGEDQLWEIDELTAVASPVGTYAVLPSGYDGATWPVLDAGGRLHGGAYLGTRELLMARPLQPGTITLLYAEPTSSTNFSAATFQPVFRLDRILLVTRP